MARIDVDNKREQEQRIVEEMICLYCKGVHSNKTLCNECKDLLEYSKQRSDRCPFMEEKTFCSNCKVHCYKPEMRKRIKAVMRYAGPRILFHHPVLAVKHMYYSQKEKRALKRL